MRRSSKLLILPAQKVLPVLLALAALAACSADQGVTLGGAGTTSAAGGSALGASGASASGAGGQPPTGSAGAFMAPGGAPGSGDATSSGGLAEPSGGTSGGPASGMGGAPVGGFAGASAGSAGAMPHAGSGSAGSAGSGGSDNSFSPCPVGAGSACFVLPLGDSITEGYGSSGGGYRVELFRQALQNGKNFSFVGSLQNGPNSVDNHAFPKSHEGHGGFTIDSGTGHSGISGAITQQAITAYHPNIVLLMIGTNDINGNIDVSAAPTRLGKLIDDITTRAPNALVVVATIIPVANDGTNPKVKTYDAALPALVSARAAAGKHVMLVDNYAAFSKDPSYKTTLMYDYLHPNDAGYAVLGKSFYDAISAALK